MENIPLKNTILKIKPITDRIVYSDTFLKMKQNRLINWGFNRMESVLVATAEAVQPAVKIFQGPINIVDHFICRSIDFAEQKVPSIYLPPEMMYSNTKEYMADHIVRPVLKRANSVKHIGNAVLDSRVSTYAAGRIDGAIDAADKYVERYLPPEDQTDVGADEKSDDEGSKPVHTLHKSQRFSRKLKRRLTQRTFAEARAFKKSSKEAVHIVKYAAELIVYDPKLAVTKLRDLWLYLSQDEPGNQARPQTLEHLLMLLTRESARKCVHLANYAANSVAQIPRSIGAYGRLKVHQISDFTSSMLMVTQLKSAKNRTIEEALKAVANMKIRYGQLQQYSTTQLETFAFFLAGQPKAGRTINAVIVARNNPQHVNSNGVHH